ncbi:hypothetical protein AAFN47_02330 [Hoeflea sp. CAU 1731]
MKPHIQLAALLILPILAGGCVSASLEDAAPRTTGDAAGPAAGQPAPSAETAKGPEGRARPERKTPPRDTSFVQEGAAQDDTFPTFGPTPTGAMEQLSEAEKKQIQNEMESILKQRKPPSASATSDAYKKQSEEFEAIARSHGDEAKAEIEN